MNDEPCSAMDIVLIPDGRSYPGFREIAAERHLLLGLVLQRINIIVPLVLTAADPFKRYSNKKKYTPSGQNRPMQVPSQYGVWPDPW